MEPSLKAARRSSRQDEKQRHHFRFEHHDVGPSFWHDNTTQRHCHNDHGVFTGPIFSYPVNKQYSCYTVSRMFCSLHCTKRFIIDHCFLNTTIVTLFAEMCAEVYQLQDEVAAAPPVEMLSHMCIDPTQGLTLERYRAYGPSQRRLRIVVPPVFPFQFQNTVVVEEPLRSVLCPKKENGCLVVKSQAADTPMSNKSRGISSLKNFYAVVEDGDEEDDVLPDGDGANDDSEDGLQCDSDFEIE